MGNCLTSSTNNKDKIVSKTNHEEEKSQLGKRKIMKFEECKEGGGRMRIRVVVTKEELKEILMMSNNNKDFNLSSVEQLVKAVRLRDTMRRRMIIDDYNYNGTWKPALESIPEDH